MASKISFIALIIILGLVNLAIFNKEELLSYGKVIYLPLAPVDPRSLMQGDYMALRFALAADIQKSLGFDFANGQRETVPPSDGKAVVLVDQKNIGTFQRIYHGEPLADNEVLMHYRVRGGTVKLATNAFFFQEGHSQDYARARYGQFRVDNNSEILLAALHDGELNRLEARKASSEN